MPHRHVGNQNDYVQQFIQQLAAQSNNNYENIMQEINTEEPQLKVCFQALYDFIHNACQAVNLILTDIKYHEAIREVNFSFKMLDETSNELKQLVKLKRQLQKLPYCSIRIQEESRQGRIIFNTNHPIISSKTRESLR